MPRIRDAGFPIAMGCFYGLEGGSLNIDNIKMYPKMGDAWGGDGMIYHAQDFKADVVFSLQDIWVLDPNYLKQIKRWITILPVDHEPIPPAVLQRAKMAYRIVTYSKFGKEEIENAGLYSTYIPHSVETELFKPIDKIEAKKKLKIPEDLFLFGMVSANKDNPPRKAFQEVMDAFKMFHDVHPKSALYFHVLLQQQGGFPIEEYATLLGIRQQVFFTPVYDYLMRCGRNEMNGIYNAFDCLLSPSTNEGFGVPIAEAASCGVPVIVNDFTAMKDLVIHGVTGYKCKVYQRRFDPIGSFVAITDTKELYNAMVSVYKADRVKMGEEARKFIVENYDANKIFNEKWLPFLTTLEKEVYT